MADLPPLLALIVNPVAGLGGRVGLKGSDGAEVQERARALGARPAAGARAQSALEQLLPARGEWRLVTCTGEMGEDVARACGIDPILVGRGERGRRCRLWTSATPPARRSAASISMRPSSAPT